MLFSIVFFIALFLTSMSVVANGITIFSKNKSAASVGERYLITLLACIAWGIYHYMAH